VCPGAIFRKQKVKEKGNCEEGTKPEWVARESPKSNRKTGGCESWVVLKPPGKRFHYRRKKGTGKKGGIGVGRGG